MQNKRLTSKDLDRSKDKNFTPVTKFGEKVLAQTQSGSHFDIAGTKENIFQGVGAVSAGTIQISANDILPCEHASLPYFITKYPGEDTHRIPSVFTDKALQIFMAAASIEYAASKYATDKLGIAFARVRTLEESVLQTAPAWHTHLFPIKNIEQSSMVLSDKDLQIFKNVSPNIIADEFVFSNRCGTNVQTQPSSAPITAQSGNDVYITQDFLYTPPFEHRQAEDGELTIASGAWHKSARPTKNDDGEQRVLLVMAYLHTQESEAMWRADQERNLYDSLDH